MTASDLARQWALSDPEPSTRAELEALIDSGADLSEYFTPELAFGTAGIRGKVGPGPARMNRAVIIRTTHGLARYLADIGSGPVVVGFDARPTSRQFAEDTASVLVAAGTRVIYFPSPTPTPLVAYAARIYQATAAVVVTASHNPPEDNGYKVYGPNAAQIIPPADTEIEARIRLAPPAAEVPYEGDVYLSALATEVPSDVFDRYRTEVEAVRPKPVSSDLRIVYTPIHGVGGEPVTRLLEGGGHPNLVPVAEQFTPDGTFPTVRFPNPEEPGVLDLAIQTAVRVDADVIIANDPDADRLAAALPRGGEWVTLTGNDLGCLMADFVLTYWSEEGRPIVVSSIVSSPMLGRIANARNAHHESTLTGFKWIVNAGMALEQEGVGRFAYGYEEALGYTVGNVVRDKDGMSAALVFCDLVAHLRADGETVWDRLVGLWQEVGVWASGQHSIVRTGPEGAAALVAAVDRLAANPPEMVGDFPVEAIVDYRLNASDRPLWLGAQDLVELSLGVHGRVLVRPSGTEPKLKIYADLSEPAGTDPISQQTELVERARGVASRLGEQLDL